MRGTDRIIKGFKPSRNPPAILNKLGHGRAHKRPPPWEIVGAPCRRDLRQLYRRHALRPEPQAHPENCCRPPLGGDSAPKQLLLRRQGHSAKIKGEFLEKSYRAESSMKSTARRDTIFPRLSVMGRVNTQNNGNLGELFSRLMQRSHLKRQGGT